MVNLYLFHLSFVQHQRIHPFKQQGNSLRKKQGELIKKAFSLLWLIRVCDQKILKFVELKFKGNAKRSWNGLQLFILRILWNWLLLTPYHSFLVDSRLNDKTLQTRCFTFEKTAKLYTAELAGEFYCNQKSVQFFLNKTGSLSIRNQFRGENLRNLVQAIHQKFFGFLLKLLICLIDLTT